MPKLLKSIIILAALSLSACSQPESSLQARLESLVKEFPGDVGIAIISSEDTVCINGDARFPMFSVVKFHQALAVSESVRSNKCFQPYDIEVEPEDLKPDTWSPMREKFPDGGRFPIFQLVEYALIESDNNACDILFNNIAAPDQVESYIHSLGITDCGIAWTEDDQHADIYRSHENWTTPLAAAKLMEQFYGDRDRDEYSRFVWKTMSNCKTGTGRIPKYIADSCSSIVHKTGTGGSLPDGKTMGINDIGCIVLPDGSHFVLAVLIKDASCDAATCEELIAVIARECLNEIQPHNE